MIDGSRLKDLLSKPEFSKTDKVLICLAVDADQPSAVKNIRALAISSGLRAAKSWNISQLLSASNGLAVRTDQGWELTSEGKRQVAKVIGSSAPSPTPNMAANLRQYIPKLADKKTRDFVREAIECYESQYLRAAVVLSWVGAISLLHRHVVDDHLVDFNAEALRRDSRWKNAKTTDDIGRMKESDFLNVVDKLSIIGKNVKQELETCLKLRNSCGHPNSLKIGESRVAAHMEILILNIFSVFT